MSGAEPFSSPGDRNGVLVLHGFTGTPQSMRPLAEAFAARGWSVELPLLPGHGTSLEDMLATSWDNWSGAAEAAYRDLAARCDRVVVAGLSMGGSLSVWLAEQHPEVAGLVLVNPLVDARTEGVKATEEAIKGIPDPVLPAIGSDIAAPGVVELAYDGTPVKPLLSLIAAVRGIQDRLAEVRCPVLVLTSVEDHVVEPVSSDMLAAGVSGPVTRVTLERSFHVATLDHDRELINERAVAFGAEVFAG